MKKGGFQSKHHFQSPTMVSFEHKHIYVHISTENHSACCFPAQKNNTIHRMFHQQLSQSETSAVSFIKKRKRLTWWVENLCVLLLDTLICVSDVCG